MSIPGTVFVELPYIPPPFDPNAGWDGLTMTWTGWDGSLWHLTDPSTGIELKPGVEGLHMPTFAHQRDESPAVRGAYWRGYQIESRKCFWPMRMFQDDSTDEFIALRRAFTRTLHPGKEGTWTVYSGSGRTPRRLRLRYEEGWDGALERDPTAFGWVDHGPSFMADQPLWEGDPIVVKFEQGTIRDFIDPAGSPPFYISSGASVSQATMANPGDEDAYPIWKLDGPFTSATINVAGQVIGIPFSTAAGRSLTIDTRPSVQSAWNSDGADRTASLSSYGFAPIPPGANVPITLTLVGTGTVTATLTPLYMEAY